MENKRVIGPPKEIKEVENAHEVYSRISEFHPYSAKAFLLAHQVLMNGLIPKPGRFRSGDVGIMHGSKVAHMAPPPDNVPTQMNSLFDYLKMDNDLNLIKSCVFHYEMEFIHPFKDGNGRMGRFWQTLILMQDYPVFEYIPFETLVKQTQNDYYDALKASDHAGSSTLFIEYMLAVIDHSLDDYLKIKGHSLSEKERIQQFMETGIKEFTRKDYMDLFKSISSSTASRDLRKGVEMKLFNKAGMKNKTVYRIAANAL